MSDFLLQAYLNNVGICIFWRTDLILSFLSVFIKAKLSSNCHVIIWADDFIILIVMSFLQETIAKRCFLNIVK